MRRARRERILPLSYLVLVQRMAPPDKLTTVVSTKGQVILPKAIRDRYHLDAGTRLTVETTQHGILLKPAPSFAPTRMENVFGCLPWHGAPKTIEEMDASIAAETRRRHARDRY